MNIFVAVLVFVLATVNVYFYFSKRNKCIENKKHQTVPKVKGRLPLVGNGLQFMRNVNTFIRESYKTYGKIFKVNLFGKEFVFICDREMHKSFFKHQEDALSLYALFESIFVVDSLVDCKRDLMRMVTIFKSAISLKAEYFEIMNSEAKRLIEDLTRRQNEEIKLGPHLKEYVTRTSFRCFISSDVNEKFFKMHHKFSKLVNLSIIMSYLVPMWVLQWLWRPVLRYYRKQMYPLLFDTIESYRENGSSDVGEILRKAVDFSDESSGESLSNEQIADIIISFMWISTENTALGFVNAAIDLIVNSKYWFTLKEEVCEYIKNDDCKKIINNSLLTACIMESARLNTHVVSICRIPTTRDLVIGKEKFWIGDANVVAISPPLMQMYECSEGIFEKSYVYNPFRYSSEHNNESFSSKNVLTWGSGVHLCPGKEFGVCEIKIGLAFLVNYLQIMHYWGHEQVTHFSSSAFVERDICMKITTN